MIGPGFRITWRRARGSTTITWQLVAEGLLASLPQDQRDALVSVHTVTSEGSRRFVLKETRE